jgi:hypothetical protein
MKKNIYIKSFLVFLTVLTFSCTSDDNKKTYSDSSKLHFLKETASVAIQNGGADITYDVDYSAISPVVADSKVSLVIDAAKSTAVEGVDFEMVSDDILKGEANGIIKVKFYGTATQSKVAVFKLQSSAIDNAVFKQELKITTVITCPVPATKFVGRYLIQEITPVSSADGSVLSDNTVVDLVSVSATGRSFKTFNFPQYCSSTKMDFIFDLVCGSTVSRLNRGICSCGPNYFFDKAIKDSKYNVNDDSVFELTFTNDSLSDCGAPTQTTYRFTKQ